MFSCKKLFLFIYESMNICCVYKCLSLDGGGVYKRDSVGEGPIERGSCFPRVIIEDVVLNLGLCHH